MDGHHSRLVADAALHHALFSGPVVRMHACKLAMKGNKLLAQLLEDDHTTHVCFSTHGCRTAANVSEDSQGLALTSLSPAHTRLYLFRTLFCAAARAAEAGSVIQSSGAGVSADTPAQLQQLLSAAQADESLLQQLMRIMAEHKVVQVCIE
jgi:hypothetical protein